MRNYTHSLVTLFFVASLLGCSGPQKVPDIPGEYGVWYIPEFKVGMTPESAKATLRETLESYRADLQKYNYEFPAPKVLADRIDAPPRAPLLFSNLPGNEIKVYKARDCFMVRDDNRSELLHSLNFDDAKRMADALYFLQQEEEKKARDTFASQVANYRALAVKPVVTEEQRKLIVQANALSQQKAYTDALEFYNKVLAIDPVSYPAAYFNMALLSAQENRFRSAIGYMKKYLLLESSASDARSAQDKVYEWELMVSKKR